MRQRSGEGVVRRNGGLLLEHLKMRDQRKTDSPKTPFWTAVSPHDAFSAPLAHSDKRRGILEQKYRDRNGRCIAILFKSIGVTGRSDSPEFGGVFLGLRGVGCCCAPGSQLHLEASDCTPKPAFSEFSSSITSRTKKDTEHKFCNT